MKLKSSVAVLMVAVALSACGADSSSTSSVVVTTASSQSTGSQPSTNVDNFVAKTVSDETFVLSNALAQKPVVLWFWAPG